MWIEDCLDGFEKIIIGAAAAAGGGTNQAQVLVVVVFGVCFVRATGIFQGQGDGRDPDLGKKIEASETRAAVQVL